MASKSKDTAKAKLSTSSGDFPPTYWTIITNENAGWTQIVVPSAGTLWVFYEWNNAPAAQIFVWHQGDSITPIQEGPNTIAVGDGDFIMYQLTDPENDDIKIGYQMQ